MYYICTYDENGKTYISQIIQSKEEAEKHEHVHWDVHVSGPYPKMKESYVIDDTVTPPIRGTRKKEFVDSRSSEEKRRCCYRMELDPYRNEMRGQVEDGGITESEYLTLALAKKQEIKDKYPV